MTPAELRAAIKALGLTQHTLAERLQMGRWGFQSVGKWCRGETPIPGPAAVAIGLLLEKAEWIEPPRIEEPLGVTWSVTGPGQAAPVIDALYDDEEGLRPLGE